MASIISTVVLLTSFTLYLLDQGTDALTSLLYFLDGHYLEGCLTGCLVLAPGVAMCLLELRDMWRGRGNCLLALGQLVFCPLTSLLTIIFRSVGLSILLCFLGWWSTIIIFIMFFTTVLTALCIGDSFLRASIYGIWSFLVPVGYARDPTQPLDYKRVDAKDPEMADINSYTFEAEPEQNTWMPESEKESTLRSRSSYFLTSHTLSSLLILYPSVAIVTILVQRAQVISTLHVSTKAIFPVTYLSYLFLPMLGLCLALSILIVRPFHRADREKGEILKGTIVV